MAARGSSFWNPPPGQLQPIPAAQQQQPTPVAFGGWNAQNIFDEDYWQQVNEQAKQGMFTESRDDISRARDAFIQPYEQQFHAAGAAQGVQEEGGSGLLGQDPRFRAFVQTGQYTKPQTPTQQWNAAPDPTPAPTQDPAAPPGPSSNDLMKFLMERAQQGLKVDRNDPNIRAQVDPYVAQQTRASRNYLSDLAEREGGAPVNLRGEERMASERLGAQAGGFEAEIIGREIGARRDEIAQALQMWGNQLSNDQRLALEKELALLNDKARTADRNQSWEAFLRELALREWQAGNENDWRWAGL